MRYLKLLLCFLLAPYLSAASYYVDNTAGVDSNAGTSSAAPWKTISKVNSTSFVAGDIVNFKRGSIWTGTTLVIDSSGSSGNPVTYQAYGSGNRPEIVAPSGSYLHSIEVPGDWNVVKDVLVRGGHEAGVRIDTTGNNNRVDGIEATATGIGVMILGSDNLAINNYIHDLTMVVNDATPNNDYGAECFWIQAANVEISYNYGVNCKATSIDFGSDGGFVEVFNNGDTAKVHHNRAVNTNGFFELGASGGGSAANVLVHHNIIYNSGGLCFNQGAFSIDVSNFKFENNTLLSTNGNSSIVQYILGCRSDLSAVSVKNNIFYSDTQIAPNGTFTHTNNLYNMVNMVSGSGVGYTLGSGESAGDPQFATLGTDFHLTSLSPAINIGANLGYTADFDETPVGASPEVGAYEFVTTTALKTLADSMIAGQWVELTGVDTAVLHGNGSNTGEDLTFSHSGQWDSLGLRGYFIGCGHYGGADPRPPFLFRFNPILMKWEKLLDLGLLGVGAGHNYDHTSFDPWRRRLYHRSYDSSRIYGYDTAIGFWLGLLTTSQYDLGNVAEGTTWFDGLYGSGVSSSLTQGALLVYSGEFFASSSGTQVHLWEPNKGTGSTAWSEINGVQPQQTCTSNCGNYHTWAEYSKPYNVAFVGGGNIQPRKIAVINANRTVTAVPDAPIDVRIQGANAVVDPRSGKLLVYGQGQFWELGLNSTGTAWVWAQLPNPPATITADSGLGNPSSPDLRSIFSMPIDTHGVIMYVRCQQDNPCRTYLYKNVESDFDIRARAAGVISSRKMDTPADLYYSWDNTNSVINSAFAGRTRYGLSADKAANPGNTTAVSVSSVAVFPDIDRTVKPSVSSAGSLLFRSPSMSPAGGGGIWEVPLDFNDRTNPWIYIAPGSPAGNVLWTQYKVRFNAQQLSGVGEVNNAGRKVDVAFGNPPLGSNSSSIETTGVIDFRSSSYGLGVPTWYGSQGHDPFPEQSLSNCQDGGPYTGCFRYVADTWYTVTKKETVNAPATGANQGCAGPATSRLEVWINTTKIMDYGCISINYGSSDGNGIGSIGFWEYVTNRSPSVHAEGRTWIADVIVSTQAIDIGVADTTAPTNPASLIATAITSSGINLTWTASTDAVGVAGYQIERCQGVSCSSFVFVASSTTNSYSDTGLLASTTYGYRVRAYDAVPNYSGYSNTSTAATLASGQGPVLPAHYFKVLRNSQ